MFSGLPDIKDKFFSLKFTNLPSLAAIGLVEEEILFLIFHVTPCNHVVRESCDIMDEFPSL